MNNINKENIINIWLDDTKEVGIIEIESNVLGSVFLPVEYNDSYEKIINTDMLQCSSYKAARKIINHYITGRLKKVDIESVDI